MQNGFGLMTWVIVLPVVGFLVQALLGGWLSRVAGKRLVGALAVLPILIAFCITFKVNQDLSASGMRAVVVHGPPWILTAQLNLPFELVIDPLSMTMALIITGIGGLIHLYATGYMSKERDYARFFTYMNLFIAAMLVLVLGNNLALLFLGWEGVGLCSYLLIGFWYRDLANARAANKAFIVNRIGDWGLTLALLMIVAMMWKANVKIPSHRFLSYDVMLAPLYHQLILHPAAASIIAGLLFVGAAGKSAQFPLYLWLPDAMAGPTPVSALNHAATRVTSGVVLLNRMHIVFEMAPAVSAVIAIIGAFTALFAAVIAFGQTDIKRVLAYSTVSQLGFMFIACGAGSYAAGMFHVATHAFFKALLFLGAGSVIYAMGHDQDMRNYGRLSKYMPITTWTMVIGWLAIAAVAIPIGGAVYGFAGAYSKEAILSAAIGGNFAQLDGVNLGLIAGWVGLGVAILTGVYMTRLTFLTFFGKEERWRNPSYAAGGAGEAHSPHPEHEAAAEDVALPLTAAMMTSDVTTTDREQFFYAEEPAPHDEVEEHHGLSPDHTPHEVSPSMWLPLVVLAILSLGGGYVLAKNNAFMNWLSEGPSKIIDAPAEVPNLALYSAIAAIGGVLLGVLFYAKGLPADQGWDESRWRPWRKAARGQFGFDAHATGTVVEGGGEVAFAMWRFFDVGLIDAIVTGVGRLANAVGVGIKYVQTGFVRLYALVMLVGVVAFIGYLCVELSVSTTPEQEPSRAKPNGSRVLQSPGTVPSPSAISGGGG
jgi:NADH-quinone oxidoreductase subunit L